MVNMYRLVEERGPGLSFGKKKSPLWGVCRRGTNTRRKEIAFWRVLIRNEVPLRLCVLSELTKKMCAFRTQIRRKMAALCYEKIITILERAHRIDWK